MKRVFATLSAAAVVAATLLIAQPAQAVGEMITLSAPASASVGVQQNLSATVASGASGTVTFLAGDTEIDTVSVKSNGTAYAYWTPSSAGSVTVSARLNDGGAQPTDTASVPVNQIATQASITTPGSAGASTQVSLGAQVVAVKGSYIPTGSVTFYTVADGKAIGSSNLDGSGKANINWTTPASAGTVYLTVQYNGDANATASAKSKQDSVKVTGGAPSVSLVVAQTNYAGSPTQLTAKINPPSGTGTVSFSANSTNLGTSNVANGVATITWIPASTGTFTLKAVYSGGNGVAGGTATNPVTVQQPLKSDIITINPAGAAGPWAAGSTQGLPNGASVNLVATSASGLPVTLAATNPCSINGTTLQVNGVGAPCTVTATTPGGNGFAPGNQSWTIVQGAGTQTAPVNPPASGIFRKGSSIALAPVAARTNVNNAITWRVTAGGGSCKVKKAAGKWKASFVKKGACTITGSAPAVGGQWAPYSVTVNYTVR